MKINAGGRRKIMQKQLLIAILAGMGLGLAVSQFSFETVRSQETRGKQATTQTDELDDLQATAKEFETAFNAQDATAIASQFTENAEAVDEDGNILEGRDEIAARFEALFKDYPKARIDVELTSLRKLSPDVAVEDGYSTTTLDPEEPGSRSPYTVVHVKRDGQWRIASVRDFPEEATDATAHEQLRALEWLVGQWVDESAEGRVETACQWSDDGNYLLQDYVAKTGRGAVMEGTQRIAWDPLQRTIRSWAFDQSGAFTEATWTPLEDSWMVKAEGVTPDGQSVSATRLVTIVNVDAFQIDSTAVVFGNDLLPDSSVRVVRRPPEPTE
jgi:uncharacterized protein (TIGR02246 family)